MSPRFGPRYPSTQAGLSVATIPLETRVLQGSRCVRRIRETMGMSVERIQKSLRVASEYRDYSTATCGFDDSGSGTESSRSPRFGPRCAGSVGRVGSDVQPAAVAKLVKAGDSKPPVETLASSSLASGTKRCPRCGEHKPHGDFYSDRNAHDGLSSKCQPCSREYNRQYRRKNNTAPIGPDYLVDRDTGCWVWQKSLNADGYGEIKHEGRKWIAHRWFFTQHRGGISEETLHHECANKLCVNPAHLREMSYSDHASLEWQIRKGAA